MKIEQNQNGQSYRIYLGDGKRGGYKAANIDEVCIAINHHWGNRELGENPNCPLCRAMHQEMAAMAKGENWRTA